MQVMHRPGRRGDRESREDRALDAVGRADVVDAPGPPEGGPVERARAHARDRAGAAVVIGSLLTMVGLIGGMLANALSGPQGSSGSGGAFVLGSGSLPWSAILFAGVVVTAAGAILWASRLSSDYGALIGTALVLVLAFTVILGGWAGLRHSERAPAGGSPAGTGAGGSASVAGGVAGPGLSGIHNHSVTDPALAGSEVTGAIAGEGAEGAAQFGGHSHGQLGPTTDQEARETVAMLAAARRATARFRDIRVAKAAGYRQVTQFIPTLGLHMVNLKLMYGGRFDPVHPPILLYQPTPAGGLELVGVAYSMPQRGPSPPAGFPGGDDLWHYHTNLCFLPGGDVTVAPSGSACRASHGVFQAKTAWLLHAWIWKTNPNGVFTEANPLVF